MWCHVLWCVYWRFGRTYCLHIQGQRMRQTREEQGEISRQSFPHCVHEKRQLQRTGVSLITLSLSASSNMRGFVSVWYHCPPPGYGTSYGACPSELRAQFPCLVSPYWLSHIFSYSSTVLRILSVRFCYARRLRSTYKYIHQCTSRHFILWISIKNV
jgi:hypothetical protein